MVELYFRDEPRVQRQPRVMARPDDPPLVVAVNIAAAWLYEIAGPFFWAAIVMMLVLGGVAPR